MNIGAFPLLPSTDENEIIQCDLLEKHLREILLEDSIYEHVKDSIPQKGLKYEPEKSGNVFVVIVDRELYNDEHHSKMSVEIPLDINNGIFKLDSIDYFMYVVENASEGYYSVKSSRLRIKDGGLVLDLSLAEFHSIGFGFREVVSFESNSIVSLQDLLNVQ